jgi:hypothetical protein
MIGIWNLKKWLKKLKNNFFYYYLKFFIKQKFKILDFTGL